MPFNWRIILLCLIVGLSVGVIGWAILAALNEMLVVF